VFTAKRAADGTIIKYKARYVCKGYTQQHGIDYDEVFAPVSKHSSFRVVMAHAAKYGRVTRQMDVKTAFLQSAVSELIYVKQLPSFVQFDDAGHELVMKLNKSLYGLKQSPRNWNKTINLYLLSIGFINSTADPCVYTLE
jgi:Reverse transcriptase (RNA-dependent DNA polymerase)